MRLAFALWLAWAPALAAPTPRKLALADLVPWAVQHAAGQPAAAVAESLTAKVRARAPGIDPGPSVALLLVQVGARRLAQDPESALALMQAGLDGVARYFPATDPVRLRTTRALADALRTHGRPNAAEPLYEHLLAHHRDAFGATDGRTLRLAVDLGDTQRRQKAFDVAEATLSEAREAARQAKVGPAQRAADLALGRLYAETAQLGRAEQAFGAARHADTPAAYVELAQVHREQGRPSAALAALAPVLTQATPPLPALRLAGEVAFAQGRYARAVGWLTQGVQQIAASAGPESAALMPWLHGLANAAGAAGQHAAAQGYVRQAREVAYAHRGILADWTPQFMALNQRLDQARALAKQAALPPSRPFRLPKPLPPPPNRRLARLDQAALHAQALDKATRGDFKAAARVGQRLVQVTDRGRLLLAGWLAQAGQTDAALWWLMQAVEREGVDPQQARQEPDLAPLRGDLRWPGLARWLDAHALHWKVHGPSARVLLPGPAEGPVTVVLPDDGAPPAATVDAKRHAALAHKTGPLLAVSPTWAQGPGRWRWAGRPEVDGPHVLRLLDDAALGDRPVRVVGLGTGAPVAAALASADPDRFVGAIVLGRLDEVGVPAQVHRAGAQRWWVRCEGDQRPQAGLVEALTGAAAQVACAAGDWPAALAAW